MLPSTPRQGRSRTIVTRQPTIAQPRSASISRPRERYPLVDDTRSERGGYSRGGGGHERSVRSQRSMGNIRPSNNKEAALPPPPPPTFPKRDHSRNGGSHPSRPTPSTYPHPPPSRDSNSSSASSMSSSGSSFLDRMKHRGYGSSSSQSSFELDRDGPKETDHHEKPGLFQFGEQTASTNDLVSYGYSIWNRVATAASSWGWSGSSNAQISGVAPSSGDSEVTRVLKAYYISKARDRADLPDWLFSERERGLNLERPTHPSRFSDEQVGSDDEMTRSRTRARGFRDIYDSVSSSTAETRTRDRGGGGGGGGNGGRSMLGSDEPVQSTSRATDRLKAIRDAKRQQVVARAGHAYAGPEEQLPAVPVRKAMSDIGDGGYGFDRRYEDSLSSRRIRRDVSNEEPAQRIPGSRVGLPTNPKRR